MNELPVIQPEAQRTDIRATPPVRQSAMHIAMHLFRIVLVVAIVLLIRFNTLRQRSARSDQLAAAVDTVRIQQFFPTAASIDKTPDADGAFPVKNADGELLGRVLQTSPDSDHIIGFSGPSNVLVAQDTKGTMIGIDVIESGDTREHVQQVLDSPGFLTAFSGTTRNAVNELRVDAVSGATLTSLAIAESIVHRMGASNGTIDSPVAASLRFPDPISIADCRLLFPHAVSISEGIVRGKSGDVLGSIQRTSPAADNTIGYQGPTNTLIGFNPAGEVIGFALGKTYDNEKYVAYVREDDYFRSLMNGKTVQQLAAIDLEAEQIEGVSGATMTSMAVANGIVAAAKLMEAQQTKAQQAATSPPAVRSRETLVDSTAIGTSIAIALGIAICFSSLKGKRWIRIPFQIFLVVYLGLMNGGLISQAMFAGWAQNGIPWLAALGLVLLSIAAFILPATTGRNTYCTHLCPHGAAQQLLKNRFKRRRLPTWLRRGLQIIPLALLICVVCVGMGRLRISLVDIEAFDAYVPLVAGAIPIAIAVIGLAVSMFIPMAYCRYGCPTGSLLDFLRFNGRSHRFTRKDAAAVGIFCIAVVLFLL